MPAERDRLPFGSRLTTTTLVVLLVLRRLHETPDVTGAELLDWLADMFGEQWTPSHGLIYPTLHRLTEEGYLEGWWDHQTKRRLRRYRLTELGTQRLAQLSTAHQEGLRRLRRALETTARLIYR